MKEQTIPRLIETDFPLREVSEHSKREKNIRHGNISTLHIWWARKPLASSRATALAALLPDDPARRQDHLNLVKKIAPWEMVSGDARNHSPEIERARALIRDAFGGRAPRVLDPFAGGGAIPLEALRLGCETYALDYNPVAVLLNIALLELPQKFGGPNSVSFVPMPPSAKRKKEEAAGDLLIDMGVSGAQNPLLHAVKAWGKWVLDEARQALTPFYPVDRDGSTPLGYYWMRTAPCQNPGCGVDIPLTANWYLANKSKKKVLLRVVRSATPRRLHFEIVREEGESTHLSPEEGTVKRARVRCPLCGGTIDDKTTRRLFREGKAGQKMMAVVLQHPRSGGKEYRLATERDMEAYRAAEAALEAKCKELTDTWGIEPVPDEHIQMTGRGQITAPLFGTRRFGDLFNARQKLALVTFVDIIRRAHKLMLEAGADAEFAKAVTTYLALGMSRVVDYMSNLCRYNTTWEFTVNTFARQALPMVWDYSELNPLSEAVGSWESMAIRRIIPTLSNLCQVSGAPATANVHQGTATSLPWPDNFFDAVFTDPPYYDNVPYSNLSDFFYVWLKRAVGHLYPDLFPTPLTPKTHEIVQDPKRHASRHEAKAFFEQMLTQAFREIHRVLKPEGIAVIVFAHKTTAAWEAVINALLEAGLYMTASWPIHTEMEVRLNAQGTASLASSIYMVCRKRTTNKVGEFGVVRDEIEARIRQKLTQFWDEGIRGADFFMSAIGPAVEAFGKYAMVEKLSGERVTVGDLLEYVRKVVAEFALSRILQEAPLGGVDASTRFYLLWRWTFNHNEVIFDEARKLASSVGVELTKAWQPGGLVSKEKEYVLVVGPQERAKDEHFAKQTEFTTMVDSLHRAVILWENNQQKQLKDHLKKTYGDNEIFWQVAQAISEVLPDGDKEKQLLQGLLYGRRSYVVDTQQRLFEENLE